jgi:hypothetical protein
MSVAEVKDNILIATAIGPTLIYVKFVRTVF